MTRPYEMSCLRDQMDQAEVAGDGAARYERLCASHHFSCTYSTFGDTHTPRRGFDS